jgi:MFS family permease
VTIVDRQLLGGGPAELGVLTASGGIGMIIAAFLVDSVGRNAGRVRTAITALVVAALLLSALSMSRTFALSALIVALTAGTIATYSATASTLIQTVAPAALRGRAVALYGLVFYTLQPIGIVTLGVFADRVGVAAVLEGMTIATVLAVGMVVAFNRGIWPALWGRDARLEAPPVAVPRGEVATDSPIGS